MAMTKPTSDQINFQNSVALPQSLTVDGTTLVVDGTNNRVGIGVAAPTTALDVAGNINLTGSISGSTVGALAASLLPSGCVLQVVHAQTTTEKLLSTSFAATNLVGNITPKRSNSRIVVFTINHCYSANTGGSAQSMTFKIVRTVGGVSTDVGNQFPYCLYTQTSGFSNLIAHATVVVDDSARPASTATHTYTVHGSSAYADAGTGAYPVARHTYAASPSTMLLIEVAV